MHPLITNIYFLSARKRQKQEHADYELESVQSSDLQGKKGTGRWEESVFFRKLESRRNTEP